MRQTALILLVMIAFCFPGNAQSISFKNGKIYKDRVAILCLKPMQNDRVGLSLQTLKGKGLVDIYKAYVDRGDEIGYIVKFLDDNTSFVIFKRPDDVAFFTNIIKDIVLTGAVTDGRINESGKNAYLRKHDVDLQTCRSELPIKY